MFYLSLKRKQSVNYQLTLYSSSVQSTWLYTGLPAKVASIICSSLNRLHLCSWDWNFQDIFKKMSYKIKCVVMSSVWLNATVQGVESTRRFLLEWLSFLYRYVPVGLLEHPLKMNERPPKFKCRDELEELMASPNCADWIKIR